MRRFGQFLLIVGLATGALVRANGQSPDPGANVLAAAREALGGAKTLSAVKTILATGRTRQVRGDNLVPIEFEIAIELPDKYVRRDEIPAQESGPTTVGVNGDELIQVPIPTLPTMSARAGGPPPTAAQLEMARQARLGAVRQDFARLTIGMFASSFSSFPLTFTYVGQAEAPQGRADVLDVKGPTGPGAFSARLFINADTHLPIMITWRSPALAPSRGGGVSSASAAQPPSSSNSGPASAGQAPPESRIFYGDYREVSGLRLPFRLRRAVGPDTVEETTFDGFKINPKIDPKKFEVRK